MLYTKINYFTHLLLTSKYRVFINLFIIIAIYSLLYGNKVIYCMNDNPEMASVPPTAEAKTPYRPSHQVLALKREIMDYAGTQAQIFTLERMRVEEEIIALTTKDPDEILQCMQNLKQTKIDQLVQRHQNSRNHVTHAAFARRIEELSNTDSEKGFFRDVIGPCHDSNRLYYLIRMYRRLRDIS